MRAGRLAPGGGGADDGQGLIGQHRQVGGFCSLLWTRARQVGADGTSDRRRAEGGGEELLRLMDPLRPDDRGGYEDERTAAVAHGQLQPHERLTRSRWCEQVKRGSVVGMEPVKETLLVVA